MTKITEIGQNCHVPEGVEPMFLDIELWICSYIRPISGQLKFWNLSNVSVKSFFGHFGTKIRTFLLRVAEI